MAALDSESTMSALSLAQALWDERQALAGKPLHFPPLPSPPDSGADPDVKQEAALAGSPAETLPEDILEIYRKLNADDRWAICLSGGGIRSAAFALGVLQRLAALTAKSKRPGEENENESALQQFEYLSTVSGGGYIGSWLSAWLFQQRQNAAGGSVSCGARAQATNGVVAALNARPTGAAGSGGRIRDHEEAESISNLRRDSHYLAPSFSAISPDLWGDIAGVVRNLSLNWVLLIPPMILAVVATKALWYLAIYAGDITHSLMWFRGLMIAATLCFIISLSFTTANRPARGLINAPQPRFLIFDLAAFLLGSALLVFILRSPNGLETLSELIQAGFVWLGLAFDQGKDLSFGTAVIIRGVILGFVTYLLSWVFAPLWRLLPGKAEQAPPGKKHWHLWADLGTWSLAGAAFGAMVSTGLLLLWHFSKSSSHAAALACVFGVPWIVSARVIADVIFISFAEFAPGTDAGLEFQARSSGIFTLAYIGWLIWFGLVLLSPLAATWIGGHLSGWLAAAGGVAGAFSVIVGSSSKTKAIIQSPGLRQYFTLNTMASVAAAIFAAILVALLSITIDWAFTFDPFEHGPDYPSCKLVAITAVLLLALIALASLVISINRYSLHSIYRNRLVRAFLGASRNDKNRDVTKNAFTDFDSRDSPLLRQLWEHGVKPRGLHWKPFHVINAALNLVSSKNLAWQERMAAPFTFSPLHCGSGSAIFSDGAYRTTYATTMQPWPYGGTLGLTLGTAMAISGAAVSPNMGYNSSPGVAFLMALFNVRLGWWLANPRGDNPSYWRTKPISALRPFFMEMFGLTSETERWVYLSDGGHFENLGIYEMVRRRCRLIVVSDAGCDPDYTFEDLGNALRKIWIDLGVRIDLHGLDRLKKRFKERPTPATRDPYWAVGDIRYGEADDAASKDGVLLYLKSGLNGTESMGILSYAISHASFPHESTANQFFTESQFESYRMLGYEIAGRAFEAGGGLSGTPCALVSIVEKLKEQIKQQP
ncbi:patatin-like phospholipase family protein [Bradyrhizobium sp.]|uniref:patatin-like phospholipase family protein n=1 Tax=Bradyrhizobium sp. TaxID=376 RepID=UPI0025BBA3BE|nr:patatin-like phospholipase family protein [Bradyrhizobium sp.]